MDAFKKDWFTEISVEDEEFLHKKSKLLVDEAEIKDKNLTTISWKGQALSLKVEEVLFNENSKFQDVLVFKSETYGIVLAIDSIIQCTEKDEFVYHEMLTNLALFSHPDPREVLIIGGGDGGVLKEVLKHPEISSVVLCEIDPVVIDACRKFFPFANDAFENPKTTIVNKDGDEYLKEHKNKFDVIITDSSDPIGPAKSLFEEKHYKLIKEALKDDGVFCSQGQCPWLDAVVIRRLYRICSKLFPSVGYATSTMPTYTSGYFGYILGAKEKCNLSLPRRLVSKGMAEELKLKYYDSEVHRAAFVLPLFVRKIFDEKACSQAKGDHAQSSH